MNREKKQKLIYQISTKIKNKKQIKMEEIVKNELENAFNDSSRTYEYGLLMKLTKKYYNEIEEQDNYIKKLEEEKSKLLQDVV